MKLFRYLSIIIIILGIYSFYMLDVKLTVSNSNIDHYCIVKKPIEAFEFQRHGKKGKLIKIVPSGTEIIFLHGYSLRNSKDGSYPVIIPVDNGAELAYIDSRYCVNTREKNSSFWDNYCKNIYAENNNLMKKYQEDFKNKTAKYVIDKTEENKSLFYKTIEKSTGIEKLNQGKCILILNLPSYGIEKMKFQNKYNKEHLSYFNTEYTNLQLHKGYDRK